mgnify:CR=1 FL=1
MKIDERLFDTDDFAAQAKIIYSLNTALNSLRTQHEALNADYIKVLAENTKLKEQGSSLVSRKVEEHA